MAKVVIVIEDVEDGAVDVHVEWDPPIDEDSTEDLTTAQKAAEMCMDALEFGSTDFQEMEN